MRASCHVPLTFPADTFPVTVKEDNVLTVVISGWAVVRTVPTRLVPDSVVPLTFPAATLPVTVRNPIVPTVVMLGCAAVCSVPNRGGSNGSSSSGTSGRVSLTPPSEAPPPLHSASHSPPPLAGGPDENVAEGRETSPHRAISCGYMKAFIPSCVWFLAGVRAP